MKSKTFILKNKFVITCLGLMMPIVLLGVTNKAAAQRDFSESRWTVGSAEKTALVNQGIQRKKIEYNAANLRDPFDNLIRKDKPVETVSVMAPQETPPPNLIIQGLVWGGEFPQAIINNKVVRENDVIEKARIIGIAKEGVSFIFEGRKYKLPSPASAHRDKGDKKIIKEGT